MSDLEETDDGHTPGHLKDQKTFIRNQEKLHRKFIFRFDKLLESKWCNRIYENALLNTDPWGECISMEDILDENIDVENMWLFTPYRATALVAIRNLLIQSPPSNIVNDIISNVAVVAVWCLSSTLNNEVEYHIDYAELYRYETNIIQPPLYAGTCQVSQVEDDSDMIGGHFKVNTNGLNHYKKFGYKGKLVSREELLNDLESDEWITIPYCYNQGILHDGDLPHLSTPITFIRPGMRRVILGFNCFPEGPAAASIRRAPEHSRGFNRVVKLYQTMFHNMPSSSLPEEGEIERDTNSHNVVIPNSNLNKNKDRNKKGITIEDVRNNKFLRNIILKAANAIKQ